MLGAQPPDLPPEKQLTATRDYITRIKTRITNKEQEIQKLQAELQSEQTDLRLAGAKVQMLPEEVRATLPPTVSEAELLQVTLRNKFLALSHIVKERLATPKDDDEISDFEDAQASTTNGRTRSRSRSPGKAAKQAYRIMEEIDHLFVDTTGTDNAADNGSQVNIQFIPPPPGQPTFQQVLAKQAVPQPMPPQPIGLGTS